MPKEAPDRLPELMQEFFVERLQSQQAASVHTLASYRDTFRLLLAFIEQKTKRTASRQRLQDWSFPRVLQFLNFLETTPLRSPHSQQSPGRHSRLYALRRPARTQRARFEPDDSGHSDEAL